MSSMRLIAEIIGWTVMGSGALVGIFLVHALLWDRIVREMKLVPEFYAAFAEVLKRRHKDKDIPA